MKCSVFTVRFDGLDEGVDLLPVGVLNVPHRLSYWAAPWRDVRIHPCTPGGQCTCGTRGRRMGRSEATWRDGRSGLSNRECDL